MQQLNPSQKTSFSNNIPKRIFIKKRKIEIKNISSIQKPLSKQNKINIKEQKKKVSSKQKRAGDPKESFGLTLEEYKFKAQHDVFIVERDLKGLNPHLRSRTIRSINEAVQKANLEAELERFLRAYTDWQREFPSGLSSHLRNLATARVSSSRKPENQEQDFISNKIEKNQRILRAWRLLCRQKGLDIENFIWLVSTPVTASDLVKRQGKTRLFIFKNLIACLETFGEIIRNKAY